MSRVPGLRPSKMLAASSGFALWLLSMPLWANPAHDGSEEALLHELETLAGGELSALGLVLFVALAFVYGAGHALSPGHGKSLVAAYLLGSRGRSRDAVVLGLVVTLTHTVTIFVLGLVLLGSQSAMGPEQQQAMLPWLQLLSGVMIVAVGGQMLRQRLRVRDHRHGHEHEHSHDLGHAHSHGHDHDHDHDHAHGRVHDHGHSDEHSHGHDHDHEHAHGHVHDHRHSDEHSHRHDHSGEHERSHDHEHSHGHDRSGEHERSHGHHAHGHEHSHDHDHDHGHGHHHGPGGHSHVPEGEITAKSLLMVGISGGMVPCPSALVILLVAVSIGRLAQGMLGLLAFSAGLGAVLIGIGLLLVHARPLLDRVQGGGRVIAFLGRLSPVLIIVIGLGIVRVALMDIS